MLPRTVARIPKLEAPIAVGVKRKKASWVLTARGQTWGSETSTWMQIFPKVIASRSLGIKENRHKKSTEERRQRVGDGVVESRNPNHKKTPVQTWEALLAKEQQRVTRSDGASHNAPRVSPRHVVISRFGGDLSGNRGRRGWPFRCLGLSAPSTDAPQLKQYGSASPR